MKIKFHDYIEYIEIIREKWGVILYALFGDVLCITIAGLFYALGIHGQQNPEFMPILLAIVFGLCGFLHLIFTLPNMAKQILQNNGLCLLHADKSGITIQPFIGGKPQRYEWQALQRIALCENLKTIELDEVSYSWNMILVILKPEAVVGKSFSDRAYAGISRAEKDLYTVSCNYPRPMQTDIANALQRLASGNVLIECYKKCVFNPKSPALLMSEETT